MDVDKINLLAGWIDASADTVFFGGAGVSTESGIPDFRSGDGLYAAGGKAGRADGRAAGLAGGYTPEQLLSHTVFERDPEAFFSYYRSQLIFRDARPNAAHRALAELEARGQLQAVITQNVDGLHQAAGSQTVLELHGSNWRQYCLQCGARYSLDYVLDTANCRQGVIPICESCGGIVRPDVVLYEEQLDATVLARAIAAIESAELLIVGGTSLAVYPAAGLLRYFRSERLVLINRSATPFDDEAQLFIHAEIGQVLGEVVS